MCLGGQGEGAGEEELCISLSVFLKQHITLNSGIPQVANPKHNTYSSVFGDGKSKRLSCSDFGSQKVYFSKHNIHFSQKNKTKQKPAIHRADPEGKKIYSVEKKKKKD